MGIHIGLHRNRMPFITAALPVYAILTLMSPVQGLVNFFLYPAPGVSVPQEPPAPLERMKVESAGGHEICVWILRQKPDSDSIPVVVYFHGNGENLETMRRAGTYENFHSLGVHLAAMDYPGYGNSEGKASEETILKAAEALMLKISQEFPDNPKFICGWSLGAAVAAQTAIRWGEQLNGLMLISAWSSLRDIACAHYPDFLVNWLVSDQYNSLRAADSIACPVLVMHGLKDRIIPAVQGKAVADRLPRLHRWVPFPNSGHNDILSHYRIWRELSEFIKAQER